jgi:hypothetical protein
MVWRLPDEVCEPKCILFLFNFFVEHGKTRRMYVQCVDFVRWYPVLFDPAVVYAK